jgi:hypothetical protein
MCLRRDPEGIAPKPGIAMDGSYHNVQDEAEEQGLRRILDLEIHNMQQG